MKKIEFLFLAGILLLGFSCQKKNDITPNVSLTNKSSKVNFDDTQYSFCTSFYDINLKHAGIYDLGVVYYPRKSTINNLKINNNQFSCEPAKKSPVVFFLHWNNNDKENDYKKYKYLGEELAKRGYIVIFPAWQSGAYTEISQLESIETTLMNHLRYLNGEYGQGSPIAGYMDMSNIALAGHSRGGAMAYRLAKRVSQKYGKVKSVISFAPSLSPIDLNNEDLSLAGYADSHLLVMVEKDKDVYGSKNKKKMMSTGIKNYDLANNERSNYSSITKSALFIRGNAYHSSFMQSLNNQKIPIENDEKNFKEMIYQYTYAFLKWNIEHDDAYAIFFSEKKKISDHFSVIQQYAPSGNKIILQNFEEPIEEIESNLTIEGNVFYTIGALYKLDEYSPHATKGMIVGPATKKIDGKIDKEGLENFANITISFDYPTSLNNFRKLSFRATQVYNPEENPYGGLLSINVTLKTKNGDATIELENTGQLLQFPLVLKDINTSSAGMVDNATKNVMETYLLDLNKFEELGADLSEVESVEISFPQSKYLVFDSFEFY